MTYKTTKLPPNSKCFDVDAIVTSEQADKLVKDGYVAVGRCINHISRPDQDLTKPEIDMLLSKGLFVFCYQQYLHDTQFGAESGKKRAAQAIATLAQLDWPVDGPMFNDLEGANLSHDEALAYSKVWAEDLNIAGRAADAYDSGVGFNLTKAEKDSLPYRFYWCSGAIPSESPTKGYVLKQYQQTTIDGVIVDPDVSQVDAAGNSLIVVCPDVLPAVVPIPIVNPPLDPDLAFRQVIPGESKADRVIRIGYHIAILNGGRTDPDGSRALLEPGIRSVPWTCMATLRAILYHACLVQEDGWKLITINGEEFGGDPSKKTQQGFEMALMPYWGTYFGGSIGSKTKPWPIQPGTIFCTGEHVGLICFVNQLDNNTIECLTVEGGQADGPIAPGTHSWTMGTDGQPTKIVINDKRVDDHAQCFVRTYVRKADGTIDGLIGVSTLGDAPLFEPIIVPPKPEAQSDASATNEARINTLKTILHLSGISGAGLLMLLKTHPYVTGGAFTILVMLIVYAVYKAHKK